MTSRREFLGRLSCLSLAAAGLPAVAPWLRPRWREDPFTLGVASGEPMPDGVVLWTRLAPDIAAGGGMPPANVDVQWAVAEDEGMRRIVRHGSATASPDFAHSVHVEVRGLRPAQWYWYRFSSGGAESRVGRTRTAPESTAALDRMRFAFVSCQHYEQGYYAAYRHLADEELDFVAHLGDYIYESTVPGRPRQHGSPPPRTLAEYRARYALYKSDEELQRAHAAFPWIGTWDDHEVENNYAGATPLTPRDGFLLQRAAAYRAFYEHQPLRRSSIPRGADMLLYRALSYGTLARLHVLDGRQYRSDQACGDGQQVVPCGDWADPERTMLGKRQERWLERGLVDRQGRWNVLAQQTAMAPLDGDPGPGGKYPMDPWSGYPAARERLTGFIAARQVPNVVVLTGDIHASFASQIRTGYTDDRAPVVATEFVGTSMTSGGNGSEQWGGADTLLAANPWVRYHSNRRGYVRCEVTRDVWRSDFRLLPYVDRPDAPIATHATWITHAGRPGPEPG